MEPVPVDIVLNGRRCRDLVRPIESLLEWLRERRDLTGAKEVCAEGECGACTVLVDGVPVVSCLMLAAQADGREVTTVEGLPMGPVQQAFIGEASVQCGFCIPGMIVSASALLARSPKPTRDEILEAIEGNLCRCTGYQKIVRAIEKAAE